MRLSRLFLPLLKEEPREAEVISHRLMLRAGMIRQESAGIYTWLPLGLRVLKKVNAVIREEQVRAGAQEILMPTLQSADLWRQSGRYDGYGAEMLRISDRQGREMLYGPTNEEMVTALFRDNIQSYRDLPKILYHIQWKFRDEVRPRFGVMRSREFLMKDGYSFDLDVDSSHQSYRRMFVSYLRTFDRFGLKVIPTRADTGPIGGELSHEFAILAKTGESRIYCDHDVLELPVPDVDTDFEGDLKDVIEPWRSRYTASDDLHDADRFVREVPQERRVEATGIEVGHIFHFGTLYSEKMNCQVADQSGKLRYPFMGSYGIGPSRLTAAIIEANHDNDGIIWPEICAPFSTLIVNLKPDDPEVTQAADRLYVELQKRGEDVALDDRPIRPGQKFAHADLMGIPRQVIIGPDGVSKSEFEVRDRRTGERKNISPDAMLNLVTSK